MRYKSIIFCSRDCTYRAPVAAEMLKKLVVDKPDFKEIEIGARGRVVMFPEPVNGKAIAIGKSKGYDMENYIAIGLEKEDLGVDTLVLTMTETDKQKIYDSYDNAINVYTVKEFTGAAGDVDIPFGKSLQDYGESFNQIQQLVVQVAEKIIQIQ